ncbi:MAG: hypothetical protein GY697_19035 [Desulfobacterales bacterium]|nr:hypothetical protein [Desulfobacterales bacterium]
MSSDSKSGYARKQAPDYKPDPALIHAIKANLRDGMLPCAVAFKIAQAEQTPSLEIGKAADSLEIPLAKCQLGLFGYKPEKKIVKAEAEAPQALLDALKAALENDRLPCAAVWQIAEQFKLPKMKVSAVCEGHAIKIKPCQLGAF